MMKGKGTGTSDNFLNFNSPSMSRVKSQTRSYVTNSSGLYSGRESDSGVGIGLFGQEKSKTGKSDQKSYFEHNIYRLGFRNSKHGGSVKLDRETVILSQYSGSLIGRFGDSLNVE